MWSRRSRVRAPSLTLKQASVLTPLLPSLGGSPEETMMWRARATYEPRISADERESLLSRWHEAVKGSRGGRETEPSDLGCRRRRPP